MLSVRPVMMPSFTSVDTAMLYQSLSSTSAKLLAVVRSPSRTSGFSRRKTIVATSARVMVPSGFTVPSS